MNKPALTGIGVLIALIVIILFYIIFLTGSKKFKYSLNDDGIIVIGHPVKIKTSPEKIWDFLVNIEENYKAWHPEDHVSFKWTKGEPWAEGATIYSEQYMGGQLVKYKGLVTESIPQKKITFQFEFPISYINSKNEFIIKDEGSYSVFSGVTYLKFNKLFRKIFSKQIEEMIDSIEKHTAVENKNMKRILEGK
ncbi:MAG: SRPBCC family protein [Spirochaetes bacterium]|nr:SRPBCC family protein [Spirochaetota bacterium]